MILIQPRSRYQFCVLYKNNTNYSSPNTWSVDQVEVVLCVLFGGIQVGKQMSGLLAGDELAIVGAERDGAVGVPDQIEEAVGRPLIRYIIFILQEIVLASFLVGCGGGC